LFSFVLMLGSAALLPLGLKFLPLPISAARRPDIQREQDALLMRSGVS
jgi:hypothetical protein